MIIYPINVGMCVPCLLKPAYIIIFVTSPCKLLWSCESCPLTGLISSWFIWLPEASVSGVVLLLFHSIIYHGVYKSIRPLKEKDCCGSCLYVHWRNKEVIFGWPALSGGFHLCVHWRNNKKFISVVLSALLRVWASCCNFHTLCGVGCGPVLAYG